jgi:hypothetical protein
LEKESRGRPVDIMKDKRPINTSNKNASVSECLENQICCVKDKNRHSKARVSNRAKPVSFGGVKLIVVHKNSFMTAFNRGAAFHHIFKRIRVTGDRRKKPGVKVRFDINRSAINTIPTGTRDWLTIVSKGATVFDSFGIRIATTAVSETFGAKRMTFLIKAGDPGRQILSRELDIGIQRNKGDHVKMVNQLVSGVIVHRAISQKVFKDNIGVKLNDLIKRKDSNDSVVALGLSFAKINRQIIRTVGGGNTKKGIAIELLLAVTIPAPSSVRIRVEPGTFAIENTV